jgi:excisionase family DNA binding protein
MPSSSRGRTPAPSHKPQTPWAAQRSRAGTRDHQTIAPCGGQIVELRTLAWQRFGTPGARSSLLAHGQGGLRGTQTAAIPLPRAGSSTATHRRARAPRAGTCQPGLPAPGIEVTGSSPGTRIADVTRPGRTPVSGALSCCRPAAAGFCGGHDDSQDHDRADQPAYSPDDLNRRYPDQRKYQPACRPGSRPEGTRIRGREVSQLELLTVEQTAELLQISRGKAYYLIRTGQLRSIKIGKLRRVSRTWIAELIERLETGSTDPAR